MKTQKEYNVYFIEETRDCTGNICGGDDYNIKSFKTEISAIKFAKKKSFQKTFMNGEKNVYEVYVRMVDDNKDSVSVWFIKDGIITHSDKG